MTSKLRVVVAVISLLAIIGALAPGPSSFILTAQAAEDTKGGVQPYSTLVSLRPDVSVEFDRELLAFFDVKGSPVYPLMYNGTTYLPVRALSGLMGEPIEWEGSANAIFIGKTLTNPVKSLAKKGESPYAKVVSFGAIGSTDTVLANVRTDLMIFYDFEPQVFKDVKGSRVYPVMYKGTTYLPVRAAAELIKKEINWDGSKKIVYIGSMVAVNPEEKKTSQGTKDLLSFYEKEVELYNSATMKIRGLSTLEGKDLKALATSVSSDYNLAQGNAIELNGLLGNTNLTKEEKAAGEKLQEFTIICEHYILVMENIAHMAAAGQDYSGLAETFLTFAVQAQTSMDQASKALETLK